MPQIPILSSIWNYLTAPSLPPTSLAISETHLALINLRYRRREFEPRNLGVLRLSPGLVRASFTEPNISNESAFIDQLARTATNAGMSRVKALSVSLPAGSARSSVISLDAAPKSRAELLPLLEWKIERNLGLQFSDLRVNYRRLSDFNRRPQWIVSAVHLQVLAQYERVFNELGWQTGLITPQHIGEAQWLIRSGVQEDQVVVSLNDRGFEAVIVRAGEPLMVREVECPVEERENEFYRLMVFYRDRLQSEGSLSMLNRVLMIGDPAEQSRFRDVLTSALERNPVSLDPQQLGLKVDPNAPFNQFAAAAGLATMAWG